MTQAFGHATIVGYGAQSVWGTPVAATAFLEAIQESMSLNQSGVKQNTLAFAGTKRYTKSKRSVGGAISHFLPFQGAELLLKHATGGSPTSVQIGSTGVYTHTFKLAEKLPAAGLSIYVERDGFPFVYDSNMIADLTLTQDVEGQVLMALEFAGREENEAASPETPTYPTSPEPQWTEVTTMTMSDGTPINVDARMTEFKISNPLADDRFKLGSRLRKGLGRGAVRAVTGKLQLEFDKLAEYQMFTDMEEVALVMEWTGPIAAGSTPYKLRIEIPRAIFSGSTPVAGEAGPISFEMPFDAFIGTSDEDEITIILENLLSSIPLTLPTAASNLVATGTAATTATVTWVDGSGAVDYDIFRSLTNDFDNAVDVGTVLQGVQTFGDTGLTTATTYYYWIRPKNTLGNGPVTGPASAVTS